MTTTWSSHQKISRSQHSKNRPSIRSACWLCTGSDGKRMQDPSCSSNEHIFLESKDAEEKFCGHCFVANYLRVKSCEETTNILFFRARPTILVCCRGRFCTHRIRARRRYLLWVLYAYAIASISNPLVSNSSTTWRLSKSGVQPTSTWSVHPWPEERLRFPIPHYVARTRIPF